MQNPMISSAHPSPQSDKSRTRVVVAMSGGVDSSVAAALLVQQGYDVIGMMLRLWSETGRQEENRCCTPDSMAQARRVAGKLGIPFYVVDAQDIFYRTVVHAFIDGYRQGVTPNPCLVCNRQIRWSFLLNHALALGAEKMATGHYARLACDEHGIYHLYRARDAAKDQSYVLHVLNQDQLAHALFPLGEYTKQEVRQLAASIGLSVAERPDSQDLCFLGNDDYRNFLIRNAPDTAAPGAIQTRAGEVIGEHRGLAFYTIGQRKGLGIAAPHPYYVLSKDLQRNILIVGSSDELGQRELTAAGVNWIAGEPPVAPFRAQIKIRYKSHLEWGSVTPLPEARLHIYFDNSLRDITAGQAAVVYQDDLCLGGGIIQP